MFGSVVMLVFVGVFALVGIGLAVGGALLLRRNRRWAQTRVAVEAVVVHRRRVGRSSFVTLDHPVPGGWARTERLEGLPMTLPGGATAQPGDRVTVWADPRNPGDVRLPAGSSASSLVAVALMVAGVGALGMLGLVAYHVVTRTLAVSCACAPDF